jgi:sigma54-dependent transcription regulator
MQLHSLAYLDRSPVLALAPDGCQVAFVNRHINTLLQKRHSQHKASYASTCNSNKVVTQV